MAHLDTLFVDVGGIAAGSITPDATELHLERVLIPLVKVYEHGRPNEAFLDSHSPISGGAFSW